jgi:hypothetical protein
MKASSKPALETYRYNPEYLVYASKRFRRSDITDLIHAELALRELSQCEETLLHRVQALQKATAIESDRTQLENAKQQLEKAQAHFPRMEHALYRAETMLCPLLKKAYDSLRRDAKWFMREEMVQDCSEQGGCCIRECGCCSRRHLSKRKKGRGHCTLECWCCIGFRGFELPEEEKQEVRNDFKKRIELPESAYFENLGIWLFRPLKLQRFSNIKSRWQQTFERGSTDKDS